MWTVVIYDLSPSFYQLYNAAALIYRQKSSPEAFLQSVSRQVFSCLKNFAETGTNGDQMAQSVLNMESGAKNPSENSTISAGWLMTFEKNAFTIEKV